MDCKNKTMALSLNYPYDSAGEPDTRPGCWGSAGFDDGPIVFQNVPDGHRVRITRIYGDWVAWPHPDPGVDVPSDRYCGTLFGIITTKSGASPYATLSASGCMVYLQTAVGSQQARAEFDFDTRAAGLLEADHVALIRRAIFLNELGCSVHTEVSMIVEFEYTPEPAVA